MLILNLGFYNPKVGGLAKSSLDLAHTLYDFNVEFFIIGPKVDYKELSFLKDKVIFRNIFSGLLCIFYDVIVNYRISKKFEKVLLVYDAFWPIYSYSNFVTTIHDLYFLSENQTKFNLKSIIWNVYWNYSFKYVVNNSKLFRVISESTKLDLLKFTNVDSINIYKVYHKIDFTLNDHIGSLNKIFTEDYCLHLGSIVPRKNVEFLLNVFERHHKNLKLIGSNHLGINFDRYSYSSYLGFVSEKRKCEILLRCQVLVFASECEGFAYPIFEALNLGVPVVAPNISVFKELLPYDTLYTLDSETDIIEKINFVSYDRVNTAKRQLNYASTVLNNDDLSNFLIRLTQF